MDMQFRHHDKASILSGKCDATLLPTLFFDIVPQEVHENVLRFFSRIPQARNWETHIHLLDLLGTFRVSGQFGAMMRNRFTSLCVSATVNCLHERTSWHWKLPTEGILSTNDIKVAHAYVLAGGGHALNTLAIGQNVMHKVEAETGGIVEDFFRTCPNVKSLSVHDPRGAWVSRFGRKLKKLEYSAISTHVISQFCSSLEELNVQIFEFAPAYDDCVLWEKLGGNLKVLTLDCIDTFPPCTLQNIGKYCRNIRHLFVYGFVHDRSPVVDLLCSYGKQLKTAYLSYMCEGDILKVVRACVNCRFDVQFYGSTPIYPALRILGNRLESVVLRDTSQLKGTAGMRTAWNECTKLRRLSIMVSCPEDLKAIMGNSKTKIEVLNINLASTEKQQVKNILKVCSKGCSNIQQLIYTGPELDGDALLEIARQTAGTLRLVSFRIYSAGFTYAKYSEAIVPFVSNSVIIDLSMYGFIPEVEMRTFTRSGVLVRGAFGLPRYPLRGANNC